MSCTPQAMFAALRDLVKRDGEAAQKHLRKGCSLKLSPLDESGGFSVTLVAMSGPVQSQTFELNDAGRIEDFNQHDIVEPFITLQPHLSPDGERFLVDDTGKQYQLWQVSCLVLEGLILPLK